jgi:membrane associated rhomboid family serine protease
VIPIRDKNPTVRFPVVTVALLVVNVAVWLFYQVPDLATSVVESGYFPCEPDNSCPPGGPPGPPWPVDAVTSMFMHGSWIHIAGNMLFLWIFGNNVEDRLGRIGFTGFYLASGFAATALQSFVTLRFGTPEDAVIPNVGASGAIAGVLGAYLVLFPRARVLSLFFFFLITVFEIPAVWFLGVWFLFQLWQGGFDLLAPSGSGTGGVAFFAHIGGFAFGALVAVLLFRRGPPRERVPAWPRSEL